ncbi:hypothetical protein D3C72_2224240 [compost metagenome]
MAAASAGWKSRKPARVASRMAAGAGASVRQAQVAGESQVDLRVPMGVSRW